MAAMATTKPQNQVRGLCATSRLLVGPGPVAWASANRGISRQSTTGGIGIFRMVVLSAENVVIPSSGHKPTNGSWPATFHRAGPLRIPIPFERGSH
jgi:hypothetical protein